MTDAARNGDRGWRARLLDAVAGFVTGRPRVVLGIAVALAVAAVATLPGLRLSTSRTELVSPDSAAQKSFVEFVEEFGTPDVLIAVAQGGDADGQRRALDRLAAELRGDPRVKSVLTRIDLDALASRGLYLLPPEQVEKLADALEDHRDEIARIAQSPSVTAVVRMIAAQVTAGVEGRSAPREARESALGLGLLEAFLSHLTASLRGQPAAGESDPLRSLAALAGRQHSGAHSGRQRGIDERGYFVARDGSLRFAFIRPSDPSDDDRVVVPFVELARSTARRLPWNGGVRVGFAGIPALIADEMTVLNRDMVLTSALAVAGVVALLIWGFRSGRQVLLALAPLLLGVLLTFSYIRLTSGKLTLITSVFVSTLLGLGIDFAVHVLARFNQARRAGAEPRDAARQAILVAGPGTTTSAVATAAAFFATAVSDFKAFAELGVITGIGLLACAAGALTVLPALLALGIFRNARPRAGHDLGAATLARAVVARRHAIVLVALLLSVALAASARRVGFSYDLERLLPSGSEAVELGKEMSQRSDFTAEVATIVVPSLDEARRVGTALAQKSTVARVESAADLLPPADAVKRARAAIQRMEPVVAAWPPVAAASPPDPRDAPGLAVALRDLEDALQDARFVARQAAAPEAPAIERVLSAVHDAQAALQAAAPALAAERLAQLNRSVQASLARAIGMLRANLRAVPLTAADLPADLRERFISTRGRFAVYAFPNGPTGDRAFLQRFVADLRAVHPLPTGFSINFYEISQSIRSGFRHAAWLSMALIALMVLLDYRGLKTALLALFPLGIGIVGMLGLMGATGIDYNLANLVGVPLIVGIGVAGGVQLLHRLRQEDAAGVASDSHDGVAAVERALAGTWVALLLSAATTLIGFGSLALARHRGIASLGSMLCFGVFSCLVTSTLILPATLAVLRRRLNKVTP